VEGKGDALKEGGGSTWLTPSFDVDANILYRQVGNTHPDTDGDNRIGDNLYCNSDLAMDPGSGKLLWYYQYTPHDIHDYDCNQPVVLVDTTWRGEQRKLLLHANRNGFLYVLDRTTGRPLMATRMVNKLTWATGINPKTWRPDLLPGNEVNSEGVKTAPAVRGATNWYSAAFSPATHLYYVMTVEDYTIFRKAENGGFARNRDPKDPAQKILRAFDIDTGNVAWQIAMPGPAENNYSGVLSTAGGVLFFGESTGGFSAVDERTGKYLWHFETHAHPYKGSPMTYLEDGRQYVAIAAGANILSFARPDGP
jgi:alcohol dehydrogenase (cytochrome c)